MPKYLYKCGVCLGEIEIWHSMSSRMHDCAACETNGSLTRIPATFRTTETKEETQNKVGELVKSSIEDFRKDLNDEKKRIKEEFYEA